MILKIKGWSEVDWHVQDNITSIHYDYTTRGNLNNPKSGKIDLWIDDIDKKVSSPSDRFIKCTLLRPSGEWVTVFETIAYLCNNEGKTIEKLIP